MRVIDEESTLKCLDVFKNYDDWVTIAEYADTTSRIHPELLENNKRNLSNGSTDTPFEILVNQIGNLLLNDNRFSHRETFEDNLKKIKYSSLADIEENKIEVSEAETESLSRTDIIRRDTSLWNKNEKYRYGEFERIRSFMNRYFKLNLEMDHASALLNMEEPGRHHPDNIQLLDKRFNVMKNKNNWDRFSWEEQKAHIKKQASEFFEFDESGRLVLDGTSYMFENSLKQLECIYYTSEKSEETPAFQGTEKETIEGN